MNYYHYAIIITNNIMKIKIKLNFLIFDSTHCKYVGQYLYDFI